MTITLAPHGQPGTLVAICGFDGSGKSTLEEALVAAVSATRPCTAIWAPSQWWRGDANVQHALFGTGPGPVVPEQALLHFNLADCFAHQAQAIMPALSRGDVVVANRYLFDMLALFEARGLSRPTWLAEAVAGLVDPDLCFVLDGPAAMIVDRVVRRDGNKPGRFDQDVAFVERYNTALTRMARENDHVILRAQDRHEDLMRQCLDALAAAA